MGVKLTVSTRDKQFFTGDVVEGTVHLNVTAKDAEGSSADELILRLVGLTNTRVMYDATGAYHNGVDAQTYTHREIITERNEFLSHEVQLASFGGKAAAGNHNIPFSVMLPPELPPSMEEEGSMGGGCAIAYGFEARLHRPGILHFDAKAKAQLKVLGRPQESRTTTPVTVGPATAFVNKLCCFTSGSMSIGFEAERSVVGLNEVLGLTVAARNDSSSSVNAMHVEIVQLSTWYARGQKDSITRTIASVVVPGAELGAVQRAVDQGSSRRRNPEAMADNARRDLQEMLAAGAGTRYELLVPDDCLLSLQVGIIEVKHLLTVRLETPRCSISPDVWTPLLVQPSGRGVEQPGTAEFIPLCMDEAPYSTAVEVEANENPKLVSVPQSAVSIEYKMPDRSAPTNF